MSYQLRNLCGWETSILESRGCTAEDWKEVLVSDGFTPDTLWNVAFHGHIELGSMNAVIAVEEGFERRCGIRNATLNNVIVGDGTLIENVRGYISNYEIGDGCLIMNVGVMTSQDSSTYGTGSVISVMNEGGGGNVALYSGLTAQTAWLMASDRRARDFFLSKLKSADKPEHGTIGAHSRIVGLGEMTNVQVGRSCEIQGSTRLSESTVNSCDSAPTLIGHGVIMSNSVVACGANIVDGAKVENCFVGESVHIGKGFSAESSLFFANSYMDNGEACAAFCGAFSTSHHKSTLLIGGMYSFFNAGSATNQSNHAYKMGPVHWGILDRGSKTASGCHILWPARVGSFSMVMGKVQTHPSTESLPFSYVIAEGKRTHVIPGINLKTVGTWRDINKWRKRDLRPDEAKRDYVNFEFPNPFVIQQAMEGKRLLESIEKEQGSDAESYEYGNCTISRVNLLRGIRYYDMATKLFLHKMISGGRIGDDEELTVMPTDAREWLDVGGLLAMKPDIDRLVEDMELRNIEDIEEVMEELARIDSSYSDDETEFARQLARSIRDEEGLSWDELRRSCEEAHSVWLNMIRNDAEHEFALGDVDEAFLREFIETIK